MTGRAGAQAAATARALAHGMRLVPLAAERAGAVLALSATGATLAFVADRAALGSGAVIVRAAGWLLMALMLPAKLGALYRLASSDTGDLEPGGLQWRRLDGRLVVTAASLLSLAAFASAALVVPAAFILAGAPQATFVVVPTLMVAATFATVVLARLTLVLAAEAALPQPRFAEGLLASRGWSLAALLVLAAAFLAPTTAWLALAMAFERWEAARGGAATEALLAGASLAGITNFLAAPLLAGALTGLYREATGVAPLARGAHAREAGTLGPVAPQEPLVP